MKSSAYLPTNEPEFESSYSAIDAGPTGFSRLTGWSARNTDAVNPLVVRIRDGNGGAIMGVIRAAASGADHEALLEPLVAPSGNIHLEIVSGAAEGAVWGRV